MIRQEGKDGRCLTGTTSSLTVVAYYRGTHRFFYYIFFFSREKQTARAAVGKCESDVCRWCVGTSRCGAVQSVWELRDVGLYE